MSTEQQRVDYIIEDIKAKKHLPKLDIGMARELVVFGENDYPSYQRILVWKDLYAKKIKSGKYNYNMAVKGLATNLVPEIVENYRKIFGKSSVGRLSLETKVAAGMELENSIRTMIKENVN
jgi:hypothetical protein